MPRDLEMDNKDMLSERIIGIGNLLLAGRQSFWVQFAFLEGGEEKFHGRAGVAVRGCIHIRHFLCIKEVPHFACGMITGTVKKQQGVCAPPWGLEL